MGVFSLPSLERDDVRPSVYHYSTYTLAVDENDHPEPFFSFQNETFISLLKCHFWSFAPFFERSIERRQEMVSRIKDKAGQVLHTL